MEDFACSTKDCDNKIEYHHVLEDNYYCEDCAHTMFGPKECVKLGSETVSKKILKLSKNIIQEIRDYINQEQLDVKWRNLLEELKMFEIGVANIEKEMENILKTRKYKDLLQIQQKSDDIKLLKNN